MFNLLTIFRREMAAYFNSAVAYIFIIVFVLMNGGLYMSQFFLIGQADMRPFFLTLPFLLCVFLPAVTMRLWAEEKRGNTMELLLTFPMAPHQLVLGKFLASLVFYAAALAATFPVPLMLNVLGAPDMGVIYGGYLGSLLLGALFLAAGLFVSGLVQDQIVAFILAMVTCFGFYLVGMNFFSLSIDGWVPGLGTFLAKFVGSADHFETFAKGVFDLKDFLYFVIGTGLFLLLNGFWLEGRMRPRAKVIFSAAAVLSAGIFLFSNWALAGVALARFDWTEAKLYTVSASTRKILSGLKAPVTARLYISPVEKMPAGMKTLEQDITGKLEEFRIASQGRFQYRVFHLEADRLQDSESGGESLEKQVAAKGVQPFQVQSIESDEMGVRVIYASLSLSYKEKPEDVLPQLMPESLANLEYMVISKIYRMTLPEMKPIAVVAPYEEAAVDPAMAALLTQLGGGKLPERYRNDRYELIAAALESEGYQTERINFDSDPAIPEGTKTLIVLEPQSFSERQKYELGRFLAGGGSLLMAVQNYEYEYDASQGGLRILPRDKNPGVNDLLSFWGLEVDRDVLVDAQSETVSIPGGAQFGPFSVSVPVKAPIQIVIRPEQMNQSLSISSRLPSLFYLWGSALKVDDEKLKTAGLAVTELFHSSRESWTVPLSENPFGEAEFGSGKAVRRGPLPLAVMVQGTFSDPNAGKPAPAWTVSAPDAPPAEASPSAEVKPAPGKLVLIGASTMFQRQLIQAGGHGALFLNSVDVLTLGDELVEIRSKQTSDTTLGKIATSEKLGWRLFVTLFMPILIAAAGAVRVGLRSFAKQRYLKTLQN